MQAHHTAHTTWHTGNGTFINACYTPIPKRLEKCNIFRDDARRHARRPRNAHHTRAHTSGRGNSRTETCARIRHGEPAHTQNFPDHIGARAPAVRRVSPEHGARRRVRVHAPGAPAHRHRHLPAGLPACLSACRATIYIIMLCGTFPAKNVWAHALACSPELAGAQIM